MSGVGVVGRSSSWGLGGGVAGSLVGDWSLADIAGLVGMGWGLSGDVASLVGVNWLLGSGGGGVPLVLSGVGVTSLHLTALDVALVHGVTGVLLGKKLLVLDHLLVLLLSNKVWVGTDDWSLKTGLVSSGLVLLVLIVVLVREIGRAHV